MARHPISGWFALGAVASALAAATSTLACGGGETPVVVRDSADVEVVVNREPAWGPGEEWSVGEAPSLSIGSAEGSEGDRLFRVGDALRLEDGRLLVENRGSSEVRVYGPDGVFRAAIGGEGEGPGELRRLAGIAVSGDSLFAFDAATGRVSLFDLEGAFRLSFRLEPTGDPIRPLRLYRLGGRFPDGSFVMVPRAVPANMRPEPTLYWDSVPHLRYGPKGTIPEAIGAVGGQEIFATRRFSTSPHFYRRSTADVRGGRLVVGRSFEWRLEVYGPDGRLERSIRRAAQPRPVTDEVRDRLLEETLGRVEEEADRRRARERFETLEFPERMPAHRELLIDREGALWVRAFRPPWETGPEGWNVFSAEGRWLGTVELPEGFRATDIGPDWALGVREDTLEVEHVELYELDRRG